jgi:hypothetical protein
LECFLGETNAQADARDLAGETGGEPAKATANLASEAQAVELSPAVTSKPGSEPPRKKGPTAKGERMQAVYQFMIDHEQPLNVKEFRSQFKIHFGKQISKGEVDCPTPEAVKKFLQRMRKKVAG